MIRAWRVIKERYAEEAFTGEGSRLYGSRWNRPGTRLVHASQSLSLATLEILVHLQESGPLAAYVTFQVEFPEESVTELDASVLPAHWRNSPAPRETRSLGDAWIRGRASAVLRVPSAILPTECNYLLNPAHEDFASLKVHAPQRLDVDSRVFGPSRESK